MAQLVLTVMVGLLGGIAIGFQNPLASLMAKRIGGLESAFVIHAGGAVAAMIPLFFIKGGGLGAWRAVPWYALAAGALGLVLITSVSYTIPRIGIAATVVILVSAQLLVGLLLDQFGLLEVVSRPLELRRLAGVALFVVGVWLVVRP